MNPDIQNPPRSQISSYIFPIMMSIVALFLFGIGIHLIYSAEGQASLSKTISIDSSIIHTKKKSTLEFCQTCYKDAYDLSYNYFVLGAGILALAFFLPRIQSFTFKDLSVTLKEEIKQQVNKATEGLAEVVNNAQQSTIGEGGKVKPEMKISENIKISQKKIIKRGPYPDDPQKGIWGGKSEINDRRIKATVTKMPIVNFYRVTITVSSTKETNPLSGNVKFHLHDSFANDEPIIRVQNGVATLGLIAWGAFTVGAEADNGRTQLELDLASDEVDAAPEFKAE